MFCRCCKLLKKIYLYQLFPGSPIHTQWGEIFFGTGIFFYQILVSQEMSSVFVSVVSVLVFFTNASRNLSCNKIRMLLQKEAHCAKFRWHFHIFIFFFLSWALLKRLCNQRNIFRPKFNNISYLLFVIRSVFNMTYHSSLFVTTLW